jgi:hypothetical protein
MKYTITRALAEVKTLKSRYEKEVDSSKLIGVQVGKKMRDPYVSYQSADFEKQAKEQNQSINDLYKRIIDIKVKIDQSNFSTRVTIAGKEYTVLEAIEMKSLGIPLRKARLQNLKSQMRKARSSFDSAVEENKRRIEKTVQDQTAAGSKDKDLEETVVKSIESIYAVSFVDPIKLQELIDSEEKAISDFENEVDYVLSESNSTTYIEVED